MASPTTIKPGVHGKVAEVSGTDKAPTNPPGGSNAARIKQAKALKGGK